MLLLEPPRQILHMRRSDLYLERNIHIPFPAYPNIPKHRKFSQPEPQIKDKSPFESHHPPPAELIYVENHQRMLPIGDVDLWWWTGRNLLVVINRVGGKEKTVSLSANPRMRIF